MFNLAETALRYLPYLDTGNDHTLVQQIIKLCGNRNPYFTERQNAQLSWLVASMVYLTCITPEEVTEDEEEEEESAVTEYVSPWVNDPPCLIGMNLLLLCR